MMSSYQRLSLKAIEAIARRRVMLVERDRTSVRVRRIEPGNKPGNRVMDSPRLPAREARSLQRQCRIQIALLQAGFPLSLSAAIAIKARHTKEDWMAVVARHIEERRTKTWRD